MNLHRWASIVGLSTAICGLGVHPPAHGEPPYVGDPDPIHRPMMHVQPPLVTASLRITGPVLPASVINGITYIDVFLAAGFDIAGSDYGNEPAVTASPLDPNQIVLTSFSGSGWGSGGNSSLFYSGDAGATWAYLNAVPLPPGATSVGCPCDQNMDWGRDGVLYGTFLNYGSDGTTISVFSGQATNPASPASWMFNAPGGVTQETNAASVIYPDQPWIGSGPLPGDGSQTNVCVAYDSFDSQYLNSETRAADSPAASPLDFSRDEATDADGMQFNDSMNPGSRIAVGPDGKIFNVYQRLTDGTGTVKTLTYLITVSVDGGQTWSVANSDHPSGAKIIAADVFSFQGNGSKVGSVNALLGGVDAIAVDKNGVVWVVYGARPTASSRDQLFLVKVTYNAGNLTVGTPVALNVTTINNYLPAVAILPNGEVGVLMLTFNTTNSNFQWRFVQYATGTTLVKSTVFPAFTSPFANNGQSNQRILGDYVQLRAVGCNFYGTFPAKGAGVNSATSIDPYFMLAPAFGACALPALTAIQPAATCAGGPGFSLELQGTGFSNGATGRVRQSLRGTTFVSATRVNVDVPAADVAAPGVAAIDLLGGLPAGGLTGSVPLTIEPPPESPGATLAAARVDSPTEGYIGLSWSASAGATGYRVRRCDATAGPCAPTTLATPAANTFQDLDLLDGNSYWYTIDAVNSCGPVP